ncbi:hypothetical protein CLOSTMETH_02721 [[Clostridium] methylpentosum DSM 5476]|uniref:Uncharacterized protein n=1 Tax=[Clostridium] methylpentosum DSM 5476 TaxID=537013 RepID=C0EFS9_9FIRM|nr:hypothetical protein CLOSTMETH_02721 [[Clostridium] methylpentosum DSM 5476]
MRKRNARTSKEDKIKADQQPEPFNLRICREFRRPVLLIA